MTNTHNDLYSTYEQLMKADGDKLPLEERVMYLEHIVQMLIHGLRKAQSTADTAYSVALEARDDR